MPLVATPGAPDANSYATLAYAESVVAGLLFPNTAWATLTATQKEGLLQMATHLLDSSYRWLGTPTYPGVQVLGFPRSSLTLNGNPVDPLTIPMQIAYASSVFGNYLSTVDPATLISDAQAQGLKRVKASSVEVEYQDFAAGTVEVRPVPAWIEALIPSQWYEGGAGSEENLGAEAHGTVLLDVM